MPNFILDYHGNLLKRPQSHGSLFEKSTAAGVLGEWFSASGSRGLALAVRAVK